MPLSINDGLRLVRAHGAPQHWLAVLVTGRRNGEPSVSLVNAAVLTHPVTRDEVVAFVARGATAKLVNLRADPHATLVFRNGWEWVAVRGPAQLAGPDDPLPGIAPDELPTLLREIYLAAGGDHDDLDTYDRVMATERRTAVLVTPTRITTNPPGTEHQEHQ